MSWAQRRGHLRPNATTNPSVQVYNPNQHSNTEVSTYLKHLMDNFGFDYLVGYGLFTLFIYKYKINVD